MKMDNISNTSKAAEQGIYYNRTDKCFDNNLYRKKVVYVNKKESITAYNQQEADLFFKKMFEKKLFKKKIIKIW